MVSLQRKFVLRGFFYFVFLFVVVVVLRIGTIAESCVVTMFFFGGNIWYFPASGRSPIGQTCLLRV